MQELQVAMELYVAANPLVGHWMNWMMFINLVSILFVWKYKPARVVLGSLVAMFGIGLGLFLMTNNVNFFALAHLAIWIPLVVYLIREVIMQPGFIKKSFYGVWILLLSTTIVISLLFDIREIILIVLGAK